MPHKVFVVFLVLFFVWVMITGFETEEIILGIFVSFIVSFISSRELIKGSLAPKFQPRRWVFFLIYAIIFVFYEIYSHIDMTIAIIFGRDTDGVFILDSRFKEPMPLTVLGNSITLTPGTLTLDIEGNKVTTYCINKKSEKMIKVLETFLESVFS